jgi:hypothetical protein
VGVGRVVIDRRRSAFLEGGAAVVLLEEPVEQLASIHRWAFGCQRDVVCALRFVWGRG